MAAQEKHLGPTCKTCRFYENNCPFPWNFVAYPSRACKDYIYSERKEQIMLAVDLDKERLQLEGTYLQKKEVKFVFPKFLYARTTNNKTIDVSYVPQSMDAVEYIRSDSLQQKQPDFPTTDEQVKEFLATHPKIKVPEKYKNPDWLFKKQEQSEVDLEKELQMFLCNYDYEFDDDAPACDIARHFYELGLNARKEE